MILRVAFLCALVGLGVLGGPSFGELRWPTGAVARADDAGCDPPPELGPSESTPADGASGVPRNAIVRVRYSPGYFAGTLVPTETITVEIGSSGVVVPGSTQLAGEDTLYFVPSSPLSASTRYVGKASGAVFPFEFGFTTGTQTDVARPDFADPQTSSEFALVASTADACAGVGARRVRLTFPAAFDDGPTSSLEYWVYLTRAEGLEAPVLLTRIRDYGAAIVTGGFILTETQSRSTACISVVAVDGLDRATEWSSPACVDPEGGVGFVGLCAVSPGRTGRHGRSGHALPDYATAPVALTALATLLTWLATRRHRRSERAHASRTASSSIAPGSRL